MQNTIVMPTSSFFAYLVYNEQASELHLTFRNGKLYVYRQISPAAYKAIENATNKGNYVLTHVINNKRHTGEFISIVPKATMEAVILPHTKYYKSYLSR